MANSNIVVMIQARDQASSVLQKVGAEVQKLGMHMPNIGAGISKVMDGLGRIGLAGMGIQALTAGAKGLGDAIGLGLNNEIEQVTASFNAFTKDSNKTAEIMAQVRAEADKTPFSFGEMAKATASLMPVAKSSKIALMDLVREAEVLAASNPLEGLEGASFSLREAMTGDFTSIIERFNLSRTTINKLKSEGKANIDIVRGAMREMGFDMDLVTAKAQTMDGRFSTFMDSLDGVRRTISKPIFDTLKDGLMFLQEKFDENKESIVAWADGIATNIGRVIDIGKSLFAAFTVDAGAMGIAMQKIRELFGDDFANAIEPTVQAFMKAIPQIREFASQIGQAFTLFSQGNIRDGILKLVAGFGELTGIDTVDFQAMIIKISNWFKNDLPAAIESAKKAGDDFGKKLDEIKKFAEDLWAKLEEKGVFEDLKGIWDSLSKIGDSLAKLLTSDLIPAATKLGDAAEKSGPPIDSLASFIKTLTGISKEAWAEITKFTATVVENATAIGQAKDAVLAWSPPMLAVKSVTKTVEDGLWLLNAAIETVKGALATFREWVGNASAALSEFASTAPGMATSIGQGIVDGIGNAIAGGIGWVAEQAANLARAAVAAAKAALGVQSPSKEFERIGRYIAQGLGLGIEKDTFKAVDSVKKIVDAILKLVQEQFPKAAALAEPLARAITGIATAGGNTAAALERVNAQVQAFNRAATEAERIAGMISKLQQEQNNRELFAKPEEMAFQKQLLELRQQELELQKRMLPFIEARRQAEEKMAKAQEAVQRAEETKGEADDKVAAAQLAAAKTQLEAANAALAPYIEEQRLMAEKRAAIQLEFDLWRVKQDQVKLAEDEQIEYTKRWEAVFKAQMERAGEAIAAWDHERESVEKLTEAVQELGREIGNLPTYGGEGAEARAHGGPVYPGNTYLVGERGPELFRPGSSGTIIPNGGFGGGGGATVVLNIAGTVTTERDLVETFRREIVRIGRRNGGGVLGGLG